VLKNSLGSSRDDNPMVLLVLRNSAFLNNIASAAAAAAALADATDAAAFASQGSRYLLAATEDPALPMAVNGDSGTGGAVYMQGVLGLAENCRFTGNTAVTRGEC
jgi:hypothetical protein